VHWDAVRQLPVGDVNVLLLTLTSLAMAEMTTLLAALYRKYTTEPRDGFDIVSPGITSRFEVFFDESCSGVRVCNSIPESITGLCAYYN
jgi:hypothetical protein